MPYRQEHGLVMRTRLTAEDELQIPRLVERCSQHDGADFTVFGAMVAAPGASVLPRPLYYHYGQLVGFLGLQGIAGETEAAALVHPDYRRRGIGRTMVQAVATICRQRRISRLRLITDAEVPAGSAFVRALGAQYRCSEYRMLLTDRAPVPLAASRLLHIDRISERELPLFAAIAAAAFGEEASQVERRFAGTITRPDSRFYLARLAGTPVGTIRTVLDGRDIYITTLGVVPAYQGRGFGRQILHHIVTLLQAGDQRQVYLEVSTANRRALSLYHSCGFRTVSVYAYYDLAL